MLHQAGATALRMPKLQALVLWNGAKGNACAFIYHTQSSCAYLTWRGTWDFKISHHLAGAWECVARQNNGSDLRVNKEQVHGVIGSHGDAIHHLNLPFQVAMPASLWQIRRESM